MQPAAKPMPIHHAVRRESLCEHTERFVSFTLLESAVFARIQSMKGPNLLAQ
jgi:hypothetical protein